MEDERTAGNEEGLRTDSSGRKIIDTNFVKDLEILLLEKVYLSIFDTELLNYLVNLEG